MPFRERERESEKEREREKEREKEKEREHHRTHRTWGSKKIILRVVYYKFLFLPRKWITPKKTEMGNYPNFPYLPNFFFCIFQS